MGRKTSTKRLECFGNWIFGFGYYLEFGYWNLGFQDRFQISKFQIYLDSLKLTASSLTFFQGI